MAQKRGDTSRWLDRAPHALCDFLHSFPDDHPLQIALRTYALSLSLALGPALLPFVTSAKARKNGMERLKKILGRELALSGFAFAMTAGVGGGAAIRHIWDLLENRVEKIDQPKSRKEELLPKLARWLASLKDSHKTFLSNLISSAVAIMLFHSSRRKEQIAHKTFPLPMTLPVLSLPETRGRPSITLDLTLLLFVRAMDALVQMGLVKYCELTQVPAKPERKEETQKRKHTLSRRVDAMVFWACSARIMWCFFYEPERLPHSYNKWIMTLANIDNRILAALRALRNGVWSYRRNFSSDPDIVSSLSRDLGYPSVWGDVARLPAYGGPNTTRAWKLLGVTGRDGIGGIPCELVHGGVTGGSCTANAAIRGAQAFAEAFALYLPVHFLPILITRPRTLLQVPRLLRTLVSVIRSATFLSSFVSSIWISVCLTRTLLLARLFPWVSHDFWDGPLGCTFFGSLVCGGSIWIEEGRRRGEIALYVLPRAIRACLAEKWLRSGGTSVKLVERLAFMLSLSSILTAATHSPESLRGLSRWTVAFVMKGPNAGFWKRKRQDTRTSTPVDPKCVTPEL